LKKNNYLKINLEEIKNNGRNSFNKIPHNKTKSSTDFGNKTMRNFNSSRVLDTQQITEVDEMEIPKGKNNFIFGKGLNDQNVNKKKEGHNTTSSNPMKQDIIVDYEKFKNNMKNDEKYKNKKHFFAAIDVLERAEENKMVVQKKETQNTANNGFWSFLNPFKCAKCD